MNEDEDLQLCFEELLETRDLQAITDLLARHPELVSENVYARSIMFDAARFGATDVVALLVERGIDVNIHQDELMPERPLGAAAALNRTETVRWLLEHGAEVNYEWGGFQPTCSALNAAIINNNLEMACLLVEAGGYLNVLDRTNRTPLTWALEYNQPAIADYLRSKGALEAHQLPGYRPPEVKSPLVEWVERRFCPSHPLAWLPLLPDTVPVAVRAIEHKDCTALFTDGLSARPMAVPPGQEAYRYAELALMFPGLPSPKELQEPTLAWVVTWMRQIAQYPIEHGTWLGGPVTVLANGDPPTPLGPGTPYTGWLLCADKAPFRRAQLPDGRVVVFYTLLPIHSAEIEFERRHGPVALLSQFAERGVPEHFVPDRPSAV